MFNVPVAIFIFKRPEKAALIIDRIAEIKPNKLYIIGDGPRNESERAEVEYCRRTVESHVTWECELVRDYAEQNRGVYENIAGGAKRVFEKEESAIFLEDDNFPEYSFFQFCAEMLERYRDDERVLWIMGSNYLKEYEFASGASYGFTQNMLPCGWASWASKFLKCYDGEFSRYDAAVAGINKLSYSAALRSQEIRSWRHEMHRRKTIGRFISWDYQMSFTLRSQNLLGVIPKYNQINNIGVDEQSIHGGTTFNNVMTERFCGNETRNLEFPLVHPAAVEQDMVFEKRIGRLILAPLSLRLKGAAVRLVKRVIGKGEFEPLRKK